MKTAPQLDPILRKPEVLRVTGLSKTQLHRFIRAGKFPQAVKLGKRASGWRRSAVAAWLESLPCASFNSGGVAMK